VADDKAFFEAFNTWLAPKRFESIMEVAKQCAQFGRQWERAQADKRTPFDTLPDDYEAPHE
jgi:hypothetical protein